MRSLRKSEEPLFLVGTSIYDDSVAPAFCNVFELAPPTDASEYSEWLTSTLARLKIDMLIPGIEADMFDWSDHKDEIVDTGAFPLLNSTELIQICKDKWQFHQRLVSLDSKFRIESSLENNFSKLAEQFGLPFLLKPRRGFGSKGIVRIGSIKQFEHHRSEVGEILMVQPIIGTDDQEYTTSAFCDGIGGFYTCMTLTRKLSRDGFTDRAEVLVSDVEFKNAVEILCREFRPIGPTNFQFRRDDKGLKLLEINPRISSSTSIRAAFGYNESIMAIDYFLNNHKPTQPQLRRGRAVRYLEEAIFYENSIHI